MNLFADTDELGLSFLRWGFVCGLLCCLSSNVRGQTKGLTPEKSMGAKVMLDDGREVKLVIPPDLDKKLTAKAQQGSPLSGLEESELQKDMANILERAKKDPNALRNFVPTVKQNPDKMSATLIDVWAPSVKKYEDDRVISKDTAQAQIFRDYNTSYIRAQSKVDTRNADSMKAVKEFLGASDAARRTITASIMKMTAPRSSKSTDKELFSALTIAAKLMAERKTIEKQQQKVTYGAEDVFLPEHYESMLANTLRVVSFYGKGGRLDLIGTGVLVGPCLVLTCQHVVTDERFSQGKAFARSKPRLPEADRVFDQLVTIFTSTDATMPMPADLALVSMQQVSGPCSVAFSNLVIEAVPPRNYPVYVLAMHRNDVKSIGVYDSSAILFPAKIKGQDFAGLFTEVLIGLCSRVIAEQLNVSEATDFRAGFEKSYGVADGSAIPDKVYFYESARNDKPYRAFGFGADTVAGNSGGGVYNKNTGNLVGLLSAGVPGLGTERCADWAKHEIGVPGEVIIQFLCSYTNSCTTKNKPTGLEGVSYEREK